MELDLLTLPDGTAGIVCGAGSLSRSGVRSLSVCMFVLSIDSSSDVRLVCCRAGARAADIDRRLQAPELRLRVA